MKIAAITILVFGLLAADSDAYARTWTDKSGRFSTEAELVDVKEGIARLKKTDGTVVSIPIEKLSVADRAFLESATAKSALAPKPGQIPLDDLPVVTGNERYELVVKWSRTETAPIAISKLPDILFRSRDRQPINRVFYAFEVNVNDVGTGRIATEKQAVDMPIPLEKAEGIIPMSDRRLLPPKIIPPSAVMDLTLRTARGLRGVGELRVAFFRDSKGTQQLSDWLAIPVDLSK